MAYNTRLQGIEAFQHVMENVLEVTESDNLWMALKREKYTSIRHIAAMTIQDIDELSYNDNKTSGTISLVQVPKLERRQLLWLLHWRDWKSTQLTAFTTQQWLDLTIDEFDEFCVDVLPGLMRGTSKGTSTSSSGETAGIVTSSEVQNFKKSIDKSSSDFPEFNGQNHKWSQWKQTYMSVSANHGIERILDDSPIPEKNSKD